MDRIYGGDTYTLTEEGVEGIGNNVTLEFDELDFTEKGTTKLMICGNSSIDKNTIHVHFSGDKEDTNQIVEFNQTDGYEVKVFSIDKITGVQKVSFIFLPGSKFDFAWFRFE